MRPSPQQTADLVTFTEEILNGKSHFLCSVCDPLQISNKTHPSFKLSLTARKRSAIQIFQ